MEENLVLMGDFNGVYGENLDKSIPGVVNTRILKEFKRWLGNKGLIDVWQVKHGNQRNYTFYLARHKSYSHIDYLF